MFELIRDHQLNIMMVLCSVCGTMALLLLLTRFLTKRRKWIMVLMEVIATLLLGFDRSAYIYKGDTTQLGYVMVRLSNFMVFFLTSAVVLCFNLYLIDLIVDEKRNESIPRRLKIVNVGAVIGMILVIVSAFTGLYYYFDEQNEYHRGSGFLICYIVPVVFPVIQYTVIRQNRKRFSRLIYTSLVLYIFIPIAMGILQIFTYGISIVNMAMVIVSVFLYIFTYLDINAEVERAHETEVDALHKERSSMKRLFDQTVTAFVTAVEMKDSYSEGHSERVADTAKRIAKEAGKSEEECDEVYYAALLHDVGMVAIPDRIIEKGDQLDEAEKRKVKEKPVLSGDILSSITEYPYLSQGARYSCERYDGGGYPEGLKGKDIPEISRIIAVADEYDSMITKNRSRGPLTYEVVREEFIRLSGEQLDPEFSEIMLHLIDADHTDNEDRTEVEGEVICHTYREKVSTGIPVVQEVTEIRFECEDIRGSAEEFSAPSVILFDSYNRHVHRVPKTIEAYRYIEYGEVWFDGHYVLTNARNMEVEVTDNTEPQGYIIRASRYEDHLSIIMTCPERTVSIVAALPDNSKTSYIGLTGENCHIKNIEVQKTGEKLTAGDIKKIVSRLSYTDRLESDLPNLQIDHNRSDSTDGILITDEQLIAYHTMSLPSAALVWHCPYIVLYYSEDGKVNGAGYREYALIKLNGECTGDKEYAENRFYMKKNESFPGWDEWKRRNKEGLESKVRIVRKGGMVMVSTENLGIVIENMTMIRDKNGKVYVSLTGDQVALTDIRIKK